MIRSVPGRTPRVHPNAFVDIAAPVIGDGCDRGFPSRPRDPDDLMC